MVKMKICGLTTEEDCEIMNCYHPDYCGFVFAGKKHRLTDQKAALLRYVLSDTIPAVGVFVDEPIAHIVSLYTAGIIQIIQLHGSEDEQYIQELREKIKQAKPDKTIKYEEFGEEIPIIKAVKIRTGKEIEKAEQLSCSMLLLDAYDSNMAGGTGKQIDTGLIPKMNKPYILAGGLNADNVTDALTQTRPYAVDISSGVESEGHKDWHKMEKLMLVMEQYR